MMLDGNSAALRSNEERTSFVERVFDTHEADALRQLREEAVTKFPEADVKACDTLDEIIGYEKADASLAQAIDLDDAIECLRLLKAARAGAVTRAREDWAQKHLEERVWALHNRE